MLSELFEQLLKNESTSRCNEEDSHLLRKFLERFQSKSHRRTLKAEPQRLRYEYEKGRYQACLLQLSENQMRHEDIKTTETYIDIDAQVLQKIQWETSPLNLLR